ncbi:uncharacterized protein LOC119075570 [Bradysia coprophila]|uniref:uncharacterized protein LOC119075570 n=1 Tax=Bradysia coprophila TaxID=38358 RepID=UPI00187DCB0F|nr:uncharacterized protein LOC119075570 [Bradysia coprophila]
MASLCKTCTEPILNTEFIKCDGLCNQHFHMKCAGVNKSTLNAIVGNPNVHWYCHTCNNDRMDVSSSINNLKHSMDHLTQSLASNLSDFTNGFRIISENLVANITSRSNPNESSNVSSLLSVQGSGSKNNKKRQRDESDENSLPQKRIILGSNMRDRSIAAVDSSMDNVVRNSERRKSVVVSNIAHNITAEYLTSYIAAELNVAMESIRVTPVNSKSTRINALQYRVSAPERNFNALMSPETWPNSVRIREYMFKYQNKNATSMNHFLEKRTMSQQRQDSIVSTQAPNDHSTSPASTMCINEEMSESEMDPAKVSELTE